MYSFRLDRIISIKCLEEEKNFDLYRKQLEEMKKHLWGVSFSNGSLETVNLLYIMNHGKNIYIDDYYVRRDVGM